MGSDCISSLSLLIFLLNMVRLYKSIVVPQLEYAASVWQSRRCEILAECSEGVLQCVSESELFTGDTSEDNPSQGPGPERLVPSSHRRSELSNTILGTFSR